MIVAHTQQRPEPWKHQPVSLADQRVVVTGGTTGIGRTIALLLASLGAKVLIFGRDDRHLQDAYDTMATWRNQVIGLTVDQSREEDVDRVFKEVDDKLGGLDILINNAGIAAGSVENMAAQDYRYVLESDLIGYIACTKRACLDSSRTRKVRSSTSARSAPAAAARARISTSPPRQACAASVTASPNRSKRITSASH